MATINYINRIQHNITVHYTDQYHSMYLARSCYYTCTMKPFYWKLESMTTKKWQFYSLNSDTFQGNKRCSLLGTIIVQGTSKYIVEDYHPVE